MKTRNVLALTAAAVGIGAAVAGAYRATHPADAQGPVGGDPGRARGPLGDDLFDLPDDVVHHEIATADGGVIHAIDSVVMPK